MATALARFDELITEAEVCRRYKDLVSERELRLARQNGEIAFVNGKRGAISYHPDAVAKYLERKEQPCRQDCGSMAATGLVEPTTPTSSTRIGTISEQDRLVAERLGQKYSPKRKKNSSSLSEPPNETGANLQIVS